MDEHVGDSVPVTSKSHAGSNGGRERCDGDNVSIVDPGRNWMGRRGSCVGDEVSGPGV